MKFSTQTTEMIRVLFNMSTLDLFKIADKIKLNFIRFKKEKFKTTKAMIRTFVELLCQCFVGDVEYFTRFLPSFFCFFFFEF